MRTIASILAFFMGLVGGVALGYGLALLLAPAEGSQARERLRGEARALGEQPRELAQVVRDRVEAAVAEGRRAAALRRAELETLAYADRPPAQTPDRLPPL